MSCRKLQNFLSRRKTSGRSRRAARSTGPRRFGNDHPIPERVAEDVLPQIAKFLESPEEKRLRRVRAGVVTAAIGLGASLLIFLASLGAHDLVPFVALGLVAFFVGLGLIINGLVFTVPRKGIADRSEEALAQRDLESRGQSAPGTHQLSEASHQMMNGSSAADSLAGRPSVTEHTTHHLRPTR